MTGAYLHFYPGYFRDRHFNHNYYMVSLSLDTIMHKCNGNCEIIEIPQTAIKQ